MKKGQVINGYRILQDFSTARGGLSKWTFAEKAGKEYFIKEFLSPTYPVDGAPGSAKTRSERQRQCEVFESHHKHLKNALAGKSSEGGNLIVTRDFFRWGTKYYKVTEKIDVASFRVTDVAGLPREKQVLVLRTVAHSLQILHNAGIVHGDLKPDNILIKTTVTGDYTTKLIDFDNSYFSGRAPEIADEVVGDAVYYSPELGLFISEDSSVGPSDLECKSDIFALGLIFHQYLTGSLPKFDQKKRRYPYVAVLNGDRLVMKSHLPIRLKNLIEAMLRRKPTDRPDVSEVFKELKRPDLLSDADVPAGVPASSSRLRGTLAPRPTSPETMDSASEPVQPSKLKGTLVEKKKLKP